MTPADDYVRELFELKEKVIRLEEQLEAARALDTVHREDSKKASELASAQLEAWKAGSDEWRQALNDSRKDTVTEDKVRAIVAVEAARLTAFDGRLYAVEKWKDGDVGRRGAYGDVWAKAIAIIAILLALYGHFVK